MHLGPGVHVGVVTCWWGDWGHLRRDDAGGHFHCVELEASNGFNIGRAFLVKHFGISKSNHLVDEINTPYFRRKYCESK